MSPQLIAANRIWTILAVFCIGLILFIAFLIYANVTNQRHWDEDWRKAQDNYDELLVASRKTEAADALRIIQLEAFILSYIRFKTKQSGEDLTGERLEVAEAYRHLPSEARKRIRDLAGDIENEFMEAKRHGIKN
jgi:hypothetical protein